MVTPMTDEDALDIFDPTRERAVQALASAASTLSEPRPHAGGGDEWMRSVPLAEPVTPQRAPLAAMVRKVREPTKAPAPSEGSKPVRTDVLEMVLRGVIDGERAHAREQQAPLADRITALESRLARAEARVAGLEAKKGRK